MSKVLVLNKNCDEGLIRPPFYQGGRLVPGAEITCHTGDPTNRRETKSRQNPGSDSGEPPTTVLFRVVLLLKKKKKRLNTESSLVFWFPEKTQHFKASVCLRLSLEHYAFEVLGVGDWIRRGFCHQKAVLRKSQHYVTF